MRQQPNFFFRVPGLAAHVREQVGVAADQGQFPRLAPRFSECALHVLVPVADRPVPLLDRRVAAHQRAHQDQLHVVADDATEDEENVGMAMTEPTPECRRILNTWTSKCVFTDAMAK